MSHVGLILCLDRSNEGLKPKAVWVTILGCIKCNDIGQRRQVLSQLINSSKLFSRRNKNSARGAVTEDVMDFFNGGGRVNGNNNGAYRETAQVSIHPLGAIFRKERNPISLPNPHPLKSEAH